jgi:dihydroflavonol-4-reductase
VRRFVYVSSVVAVGVARAASESLDEDAEFNGDLRSHYVATKRAAEELVLAERGLDARIVNPGVIHGVGSRPSNSNRFLQRIARGELPPFVPPGSLCVVGVDDVADGILRALEHGRAGRRYLLTESNLTIAELYQQVGRALCVRVPTRAVGALAWSAVCAGAALLDRIRPLELATPQALRQLGQHIRCTSRRARDELGWTPEPFERVLPRVLDQLTQRAWL